MSDMGSVPERFFSVSGLYRDGNSVTGESLGSKYSSELWTIGQDNLIKLFKNRFEHRIKRFELYKL